MKATHKAHLSQVIVTFIFAFNYSISKGMMPEPFHPMQIILIRAASATIFFWIVQSVFFPEKTDRKDILMLAVCGLFGFALNQALFYEGLNLTTPVDAAILHVLNPILVLMFASLLIGEKVTLNKVAGIICGAAGAVVLIAYGKKVSMSADTLTGNILILLGTVFYGLYLVIVKNLIKKYQPLTVMKWMSLFGLAFVFPFSFQEMNKVEWANIHTEAWLSLGYVIVFNTWLAYLLLNFSLKNLDASIVSYYIYPQVLIVATVSVFFQHEKMTVFKILAAVLIFIGVYLVNRKTVE